VSDVARVHLAPGRDGPVRGGHPWLFSGAVASVSGNPEDGDEVEVLGADGSFVARGLYNSRSQIRVRLYAWEPVALDDAWFARRIADAVRLRTDVLGLGDTEGACRLVFSEGDGLSGLTADRYGSWLSVQLTSLALARRGDALVDALCAAAPCAGVVVRTEKGVLQEEGLELRDGVLRGTLPDEPVTVREGALVFEVDLRTGQKTGFYLDQRENRARAAAYAPGRTVADVCCYSGGFGVALAAAGAERVVGVDTSRGALELARRNADRNGVAGRIDLVRADAFGWLEAEGAAGRRYGMIVLDPPRFARTRRGVPQAIRAYERLNALALRCLEADGVLVTCSCSGRVTMGDFARAVAAAAVAAGRRVQVLERGGQAADHPVATTCPESEYLKCLVCRVA
jgi:23S rRNA (cytosine1962-C5)-methyltransferase